VRTVYINGRFLCQDVTGVQRVALELVSALDGLLATEDAVRNAISFVLLAPQRIAHPVRTRHIRFEQVGALSGHCWEQVDLLRHSRNGLLLSFGNTGPLLHDHHIVAIHDASVFAHPEAYSLLFRLWYRFLLKRLGAGCAAVLTPSAFSRKELSRCCRIRDSRIRTIPWGADHILRNASDSGTLVKHGLEGKRFILAVGAANPNKNVRGIAEASRLFADIDAEVVVAGGTDRRVFPAPGKDGAGNVRHIGHVNDRELRALYEHALCLVFPSFYEGFGFPPVEAMACGCPVIVSDRSSLPEVCGEAALYCDPDSPKDIARQIRRLASDNALRTGLIEKGFERSKLFRWEKAAAGLMTIVKEVLQR
jgi:glycosyltransferase involved in cell wall biosynthesis